MRILIFSTSYHPLVGGAEVAIKEITDRLTNIEFDMITAKQRKDTPKVERIGRVMVYRVGFGISLLDKLLVPFLGSIKAWQLESKNSYSAFWCMMVTYSPGAAYIVNIFRQLFGMERVPLVLTLQEGDSEEHLTKRWGGILNVSWKLSLKRTDTLTVISTYLGERAKRLGFKDEPVFIPNGVDIPRFQHTTPITHHDGTMLITTSRLNVKNAINDVIDALALLPSDVRFQILGIGELEQSLKAQVKRLKLESRVEFVGFVPNEETPKYLHNADIFIRPSLSEGQGISFIEAFAAGIPVIATPVGGIPDFLTDGETGVFVHVRDPKSIAAAVTRLQGDPHLRATIIDNAKKLAIQKYDWDLIAREMGSKVFDI